jgi:hypothetical protein
MPQPPAEKVVFGLGGAWGYALPDLTSPARAAQAGALTDTVPPVAGSAFTEVRVHGVGGSSGPVMLEHPHALQVAGDTTTMFYRRWMPAGTGGAGVPWKLEAYSWGGLTQAALASASWLLLAPFMLYNLAHFALPPARSYDLQMAPDSDGPADPAEPGPAGDGRAPDDQAADGRPAEGRAAAGPAGEDRTAAGKDGEDRTAAGPAGPRPAQLLTRDRPHAWAQALVRVLALAATLQFTTALVAALVGMVALQAPRAHFPSWLSWLPRWPAGDRVTLALVAVAVVLAALWVISQRTAHRYESRTSQARPTVNRDWPLTQTSFWKGGRLVARQRMLHAGAAAASVAFITARPGPGMSGGRIVLAAAAALATALIVATVCSPVADRYHVTLAAPRAGQAGSGHRDDGPGTWWCRGLLGAAAAVYLGAFFAGGWLAGPGTGGLSAGGLGAVADLTGFTNFCAFLLLAQVLLIAALAVLVTLLARHAPAPAPGTRPFAAGHLTTVFALLAVCFGGVLSAVLDLLAARLLGSPVPTGVALLVPHALQIPWPVFAFAAAPAGLLAGVLIAGGYLAWCWRKQASGLADWTAQGSAVGRFYGLAPGSPEPAGYHRRLQSVARSWSTGLLTDRAGVLAGWAAGGMALATAAAQLYAAQASRQPLFGKSLHGLVSAESFIGLLVAGWLVVLLRAAYTSARDRKTIGVLWDVATFWPRVAHPFAPPCYAERAVPELVDRLRILTGTVRPDPADPAWQQIAAHHRDSGPQASPGLSLPPGPVLLTGYSQGSVIAPAVIAQLPDETRPQVALLTLACPARRLYGRAFPAYFGQLQIDTLAGLLDAPRPGGPAFRKWKNLVRRTDYIGSWIFAEPDPAAGADPAAIQPGVDQPCWDPASLAADLDPTPPPVHYHSGFWPDPRVTQLGAYLGAQSFTAPSAPAPAVPPAPRLPADQQHSMRPGPELAEEIPLPDA